MTSPTARLSRWCADLALDDLGSDVLDRLRGLLVDHLGVARLGAERTHHRKWAKLEAELAGDGLGPCTVIGHSARMSVDRAAFLNGVAGSSGPNLDDVWHGSLGHPGVGTWPAALALGEHHGASGSALLEAGVVGYEVAMRIGSAVGRSAFDRGWHPRGGCNTPAAAVAALKVLGEEDPGCYAAAIGLAVNAAAGVVGASYFSDAWYALSGQASRDGVLAALAARRGLSATDEPLTGDRGYLRTTSDEPDDAALTDGLGIDPPMMLRAGQKLYPSSGATHAALEAARGAAEQLGAGATDITEVRIAGFREMVDVLGDPFPATGLAATMSTPYVVACALRDATFALEHLAEDQLRDPVLRRLQEVTFLGVDPRLDELPPRHLGARVTLCTGDGRAASAEVLAASGHPGNPLTFPQVIDKLQSLHSLAGTEFDVHDLASRCQRLPTGEVRGLMAPLGTSR